VNEMLEIKLDENLKIKSLKGETTPRDIKEKGLIRASIE